MEALLKKFYDNNFLITTNAWFTAPDGKMYRSVWGKVEVYSDSDTLGIKTNARSANWYAIIGVGGKRVIVAGCQIHYACVCMSEPHTGSVKEQKFKDIESAMVDREGIIYLAQ